MSVHPSDHQLALYAGGDAGWIEAWRIRRHLGGCPACQMRLAAYVEMRDTLADENSSIALDDIDWDRLASEMRANIRLGLEAGACVSEIQLERPRKAWAPIASYAGVVAVMALGVWLVRPTTPHEVQSATALTIQATSSGVELRQAGHALHLSHPQSGEVTVEAGANGSAAARWVDQGTGYVVVQNVVSIE